MSVRGRWVFFFGGGYQCAHCFTSKCGLWIDAFVLGGISVHIVLLANEG